MYSRVRLSSVRDLIRASISSDVERCWFRLVHEEVFQEVRLIIKVLLGQGPGVGNADAMVGGPEI